MFAIPEQLSNATKSHFTSQLELINSLTNKAFENVEKVIQLNVTAAKTSFEESSAAVQQLLGAKDAQAFFTVSAAQAQPNAEKTLAYGRHLAGIAAGAHAEFTKAAESQIADTSSKVSALVDEVSKNAPAGSENAIALFKSAIDNANAGYAQLSKTTKQAAETLQTNLDAATSQFVQAAEKTVSRAKK